MDEDYKRFCLRCGWNDPDFGCVSPMHEAVWQCDMYRFYHPEEVKQAEKEMEDFFLLPFILFLITQKHLDNIETYP